MSDADSLEDLVEQLLEDGFDAAAVVRRDLSLIRATRSLRRLTGLGRRAFDEKVQERAPLTSLLAADNLDEREVVDRCFRSGRAERHAEINLVPQGRGRPLTAWVAFIPVKRGGEVMFVVELVRDMTGEAAVHDKYRDMLAREKRKGDELEALVQERTRELEDVLERVRQLAQTDALTGLMNRRAFFDHADRVIKHARRHKRRVAAVMCDLDHFKALNDTYGHQAGDAMLVAVSTALRGAVRDSDLVARYGGEEFVVLLTEVDGDTVQVCERLCATIRALPVREIVPGRDDPQTISVGVAALPDHAESLDALLNLADGALYEAKRAGRDRVVVRTSIEST